MTNRVILKSSDWSTNIHPDRVQEVYKTTLNLKAYYKHTKAFKSVQDEIKKILNETITLKPTEIISKTEGLCLKELHLQMIEDVIVNNTNQFLITKRMTDAFLELLNPKQELTTRLESTLRLQNETEPIRLFTVYT